MTQQTEEDLFGIHVKQILKSPTNTTAAGTIEHVRLLGYSCWCHRMQINGTYAFPGTLSGEEENVLEVDLRTSHFWDFDESAPPQNCS